jgi:hypothetical protein
MHSKCLVFFPFSFGLGFGGGGVWGRIFFIFLCSQHVPIKFSLCSPRVFPVALHFYTIWFGNCCPPSTYIAGPKARSYVLQYRTFYLGKVPYIQSFLSDGPIKLAHFEKNLSL